MSTNSTETKVPEPSFAHRLLSPLVGTWRSKGMTIANDNEPAIEIFGTDTYAWLPGGFFLRHDVDVQVGQDKVQVLEVIGYDSQARNYPMHSFDNQGNASSMHATVDNHVWKIVGDNERATLLLGEDGASMKARWDRRDGAKGVWHHWMDMTFTKIA